MTSSGDYSFGQSLNDFYIDVPMAPGQAVQTGLQLFLGEWYLDTSQGTPYPEGILGKHSQATADATVQTQTLNTQGITNISSFESTIDPVTRAYSVTVTVDTVYGPTTLEMDNLVNF